MSAAPALGVPNGAPARAAATDIDPQAARRVRWVGFDVDGVLTSGGVYLGDVDGRRLEFKRYDIQDGLGIHFLREAGLRVAIITGRVSDSVRLRGAEQIAPECFVSTGHAPIVAQIVSMIVSVLASA